MPRYRRRLGPGATDPDDPVARDVEEEIRAHIDMRTEELVARGMEPDAARAEARRRFAGSDDATRRILARARRGRRRTRLRRGWEAFRTDVGLALRHARRAPGFTAVALVIFAAGVGLTTSLLTVVDNVLMRPLPFPEPERLVALRSVAEQGNDFPWVSMANWVDWKEGGTTLAGTAIHARHQASVATDAEAFHATAARVAGPFFATLRASFVAGRPFTEDEAQTEAPLAVVGEGFWRRVLGARPLDEGVPLVVDGTSVRVVGVVSHSHAFPAGTDVWLPLRYRAGSGALRNNINYESVARLRDGAGIEQARDELDRVARGIRETDPEALYSWGVGVRPLRDVVVSGVRTNLVLLTVAVGFLLLVACANLAGLSLARATRRARETAVHLALGAGRGRLVRRVVTEHLLLALVGGGAGIVLAWLTTDLLVGRAAAVVPRAADVTFDVRVATLGIVAAAAAGLLAGIVPALRGSRRDLSTVLSGARGGITGGRGLPGAVMVGTEVALAVTLLVAGGLLLRSFQAVVSRDLGFEPGGVMTADIALVGPEHADAGLRLQVWDALMDGVAAAPGVDAVAATNAVPTTDGARGFIDLPDRVGDRIGAGYRVVSEGYFESMKIPLVAGRAFGPDDGPDSGRVTVVSRAMADRYWPGESALGRRVRARSMEQYGQGGPAPWLTVVGVVGDVRQYGFESDVEPDMYVLHRQVPYMTRGMTLVARQREGAGDLAAAIRSAVRDVDPSLAVETTPMAERLRRMTDERRLVLSGLGLFGGASLLLVCLGIYGLMSFAAAERTREMAIRAALGAERRGILGLMVGGALRVVAAGAGAGLFAAWAFTRLLDGLLVEVGPADPATYAAALVLLTAVALAAALAPSLRAARQDPVEALRSEG